MSWGWGDIFPSFLEDKFCNSSNFELKRFEELGDFLHQIIQCYHLLLHDVLRGMVYPNLPSLR